MDNRYQFRFCALVRVKSELIIDEVVLVVGGESARRSRTYDSVIAATMAGYAWRHSCKSPFARAALRRSTAARPASRQGQVTYPGHGGSPRGRAPRAVLRRPGGRAGGRGTRAALALPGAAHQRTHVRRSANVRRRHALTPPAPRPAIPVPCLVLTCLLPLRYFQTLTPCRQSTWTSVRVRCLRIVRFRETPSSDIAHSPVTVNGRWR